MIIERQNKDGLITFDQAGAAIAETHTNPNLITADMGGTSFDVAMIHQGSIGFARDAEMAGLAIQVPMLDIHTVGAGGGSGRTLWIGIAGRSTYSQRL